MFVSRKQLAVLAVGAAFTQPAFSASAFTYSVVYSFGATSTDGAYPITDLVRDKKGNFWGTTSEGGVNVVGTVFKLNPTTGREKVVHSFGAGTDGGYPSAGLMKDKAGNLWGTTMYGGTSGGGIVFKIASGGGYSVVRNFGTTSTDGTTPSAHLIQDTNGNLWGTTSFGGTDPACAINGNSVGCGTIFKIAADGTYSVVHDFGTITADGMIPGAALMQDKSGNLWGTTSEGGAHCTVCGTVFKIAANGAYSVVYSFGASATDGTLPYAGVAQDVNGNLWGTTSAGGNTRCPPDYTNACGTVFKLAAKGTYTLTHDFGGAIGDGANPAADLFRDSQGSLWGTTGQGGAGTQCNASGCGTVFEISAKGKYSVVYSFGSNSTDGISPHASLMQDAAGDLWGTTSEGGTHYVGTVFKITP